MLKITRLHFANAALPPNWSRALRKISGVVARVSYTREEETDRFSRKPQSPCLKKQDKRQGRKKQHSGLSSGLHTTHALTYENTYLHMLRLHACTHRNTYVHIHIACSPTSPTHNHMHVHTHMNTCAHIYTHYIYTHTHTTLRMCIYTHIHNMYTHIHTNNEVSALGLCLALKVAFTEGF